MLTFCPYCHIEIEYAVEKSWMESKVMKGNFDCTCPECGEVINIFVHPKFNAFKK